MNRKKIPNQQKETFNYKHLSGDFAIKKNHAIACNPYQRRTSKKSANHRY